MSNDFDDGEDFPVLASPADLSGIELARELVVVKPWRRRVWVQESTGAAWDEYRRGNFERDGQGLKFTMRHQNLRLAALSMVYENGELMYPNLEKGIAALKVLGAAGTEIIAEVANRLNKQTDEAKKDLEENSEPGEASTSALPGTSTDQ